VDESTADDGALYAFFDFLRARQALGRPPFDLEDLAQFHDAVDRFVAGDLT
jgi:hypothetical protein